MRHRQIGISSSFYQQLILAKPLLLLSIFAVLGHLSSTAHAQCELDALWASDGGNEHFFGRRVGASDDFNTLILSAPGHDTYAGAAYIFTAEASGTTWTEQAILLPPDPFSYSQFGRSTAISGDGLTAVVGEIFDSNSGFNSVGAGHVYVFNSGHWQYRAKLTVTDPENSLVLGGTSTISSDGSTIALGAKGDGSDEVGSPWGAVYVFERPNEGWGDMTETSKVLASDFETQHAFSRSIEISPEGQFLVVGDDGINHFTGAAYIFERSADKESWIEQQKVIASDATPFARFGRGIAVSANGETFVVGADLDEEGDGYASGAAYVFIDEGGRWIEQAKLVSPIAQSNDHAGTAVSISADGATILVGTGDHRGAFIYDRIGSIWEYRTVLQPSGMYIFGLGRALDLSPDGSMALIGARASRTKEVTLIGSAHVFDLEAPASDLNCDGIVSIDDLLALFANWGPCDCEMPWTCDGDLNNDCTVNTSDLLILFSNWG